MRQNGAKKGSARPGAAAVSSAALVLFLGTLPALAGDRAGLDIIGYSPDSRYFAFEEYGIQDGSGFPYSSVFLLDLANDTWVSGSPIRVRLDEDGTPLAAARAAAADEARPLLEEHAIAEPAMVLALNGDGDALADFSRLEAGWPGYGLNEPREGFVLELESFEAPAATECASYTDEPVLGFSLTMTQGEQSREVHRDARIPASRGCPLAYRLHGVVAPFAETGAGRVALVSVYPLGFEGPDRRFIAVPLDR